MWKKMQTNCILSAPVVLLIVICWWTSARRCVSFENDPELIIRRWITTVRYCHNRTVVLSAILTVKLINKKTLIWVHTDHISNILANLECSVGCYFFIGLLSNSGLLFRHSLSQLHFHFFNKSAASASSCGPQLRPMTMAIECDLYIVKTNQFAKYMYLGHRSFRSEAIVQTHRQRTDYCTWTTNVFAN